MPCEIPTGVGGFAVRWTVGRVRGHLERDEQCKCGQPGRRSGVAEGRIGHAGAGHGWWGKRSD